MEGNGGVGRKFTYSWTKNKELLPVRTDFEKYETLYPTGTILQVFRVEVWYKIITFHKLGSYIPLVPFENDLRKFGLFVKV